MSEGDQHREHRAAEPRLPGHPVRQAEDRLKLVAFVALGGALGALARYGVGGWVYGLTGAVFPWGTLAVNIIGCFALGLAAPFLLAPAAAPEVRAFVAVGLLGGFTTFSTFSFEAMALVQNGHWQRAAVYTIGCVVLGLLAVFAGFWIGTSLVQTRA